jgi:phage I-like protein
LDGPAEEVVVNYEPLSLSGRGETQMPGILNLTNTSGQIVKVSEDQLEQTEYVKALRAQLPAEGAIVLTADEHQALTAKATERDSLDSTVQTLQTDLQALRTERQEEKLQSTVTQLLTENKITPKDRDHYLELGRKMDPALFVAHLATLTPHAGPARDVVRGHGSATPVSTGEARIEQLATELHTQHPEKTFEQCYRLAIDREPEALNDLVAQPA